MKRRTIVIILVVIIAAVGFLYAGYRIGVNRALFGSYMWTVDVFDPDATPADRWNGYDLRVFVDLDGQTYTTGLVQY